MKKYLSLILVLLMVFAIAGCSSGPKATQTVSNAAPIKLLYVHGSSDTSILQETAEHFKQQLEEKTNGRYTVEIHPNFELGSLTESVEMIKSGDVQLSGVCLGSYYTPQLSFVDLPNAVPTIEAAYKLYAESSFRGAIDKIMSDNGIELLSVGAAYFRETTSNKEIKAIDDFASLNIRTMENNLHMAYWKALGANPSPLAWAEVYLSLQQGLIDAQENPYDSINAAKLYEVQKYVINTNHILYTSPVMVNKKFFDGLSPEDQEIFRQCGKDTEKYTYDTACQTVDALKKTLQDHGMTIIDLPVETLNAMRDKASGVYDTVRQTVGDDIMNSFMAALQEAQK